MRRSPVVRTQGRLTAARFCFSSPWRHASANPHNRFWCKALYRRRTEGTVRDLQGLHEKHGTQFTEEDMLRFESVNKSILDENMLQMLRNNPPDVVYNAFPQAFFQWAVRMFQRENEMRNVILTDAEAREKVTTHFFSGAFLQRGSPRSPEPSLIRQGSALELLDQCPTSLLSPSMNEPIERVIVPPLLLAKKEAGKEDYGIYR